MLHSLRSLLLCAFSRGFLRYQHRSDWTKKEENMGKRKACAGLWLSGWFGVFRLVGFGFGGWGCVLSGGFGLVRGLAPPSSLWRLVLFFLFVGLCAVGELSLGFSFRDPFFFLRCGAPLAVLGRLSACFPSYARLFCCLVLLG